MISWKSQDNKKMIPQQRTLLAFVKTLIGVFLCLGLIAFFVMHSILNQQPPGKRKLAWHTSLPVEEVWLGEGEKTSIDGVKEKLSALKDEVKELETIKFAAINDLRDLEGKRYAYQEVIKGLSAEKLKIFNEVQKAQRGLSKLKKELGILQSAVAAKRLQVNIPIGMPKKLNGVTNEIQNNKLDSKSSKRHCTFSNCFDYSHCSLLNQFSAYVYKPSMMHNLPFIDIKKTRVVHNKLIKLPHVSTSPEKACLFVYVIVLKSSILHYQKGILSRHMEKLHHWKNNGQNHLILFLSNYSSDVCKYVSEITKTKAIVATSIVCRNTFRDQFDQILYPPDFLSLDSNSQDISMSLVPIKRKYLFAFIENTYVPEISNTDLIALKGRAQDIFIKVGCGRTEHKLADEFMANCNNKAPVVEILRESVFNILFDVKSSEDLEKLHRDILSSLVNGVIPVIIGENTLLPFSEFVDYKKFIIMIPPARITEAHYILRTIKKTEVFAMKQQGRFVYETYFSSLDANLRTIFSGVQSYIKLPPLPLLAYKSTPLFNNSTSLKTGRPDSEAIKSWSYSYNWTTTSIGLYEQWNSYPGAHYLLQFIPKNVGMPPSVQFFEDVNEYMPIGAGEGGDGSKFKNALGGDYAIEHFTIVILTYDRELILVESLQRLSGLKYLNKVIVIWNNPIMPSSELEWPDIGVPLHVCILAILFLMHMNSQGLALRLMAGEPFTALLVM